MRKGILAGFLFCMWEFGNDICYLMRNFDELCRQPAVVADGYKMI